MEDQNIYANTEWYAVVLYEAMTSPALIVKHHERFILCGLEAFQQIVRELDIISVNKSFRVPPSLVRNIEGYFK